MDLIKKAHLLTFRLTTRFDPKSAPSLLVPLYLSMRSLLDSLYFCWICLLLGAVGVSSLKMKTVYFIRHSISEMNEHLQVEGQSWGSPGFSDAGLYDTKLSKAGLGMVERLNRHLRSGDGLVEGAKGIENADLLVVSPLTRTLQTASMALDGILREDIKSIVVPCASERLYLSSDCGRSREELQKEYPQYDYELLDKEEWWYTAQEDYKEWRPEGSYLTAGEPRDAFEERILRFKRFLKDREEETIVVVTHWGVIKALSGKSLDNCGILKLNMLELLEDLDKNC